MKRHLLALSHCVIVAILFFVAVSAKASQYKIDPTHSFIQFRTKHLGFSWLYGRFNDVSGEFIYDAKNPGDSRINVDVNVNSIDTNHAERDKHLRDKKYLHTDRFGAASFKSTGYKGTGDKGVLTGELTLNNVTKTINIPISKVGEGPDPWNGYRAGFSGSFKISAKDYGYDYFLPKSDIIELEIGIEGIRHGHVPGTNSGK